MPEIKKVTESSPSGDILQVTSSYTADILHLMPTRGTHSNEMLGDSITYTKQEFIRTFRLPIVLNAGVHLSSHIGLRIMVFKFPYNQNNSSTVINDMKDLSHYIESLNTVNPRYDNIVFDINPKYAYKKVYDKKFKLRTLGRPNFQPDANVTGVYFNTETKIPITYGTNSEIFVSSNSFAPSRSLEGFSWKFTLKQKQNMVWETEEEIPLDRSFYVVFFCYDLYPSFDLPNPGSYLTTLGLFDTAKRAWFYDS